MNIYFLVIFGFMNWKKMLKMRLRSVSRDQPDVGLHAAPQDLGQ